MTNTPITTKEIKIPAYDAGAFSAYIAMPEDASSSNRYPAIVLIQEIFGVNQEMRDKCDEYAKQGFVTICPDLFWRIKPGIQLVDSIEEELQKAFDLFGQFNTELGIEDLITTLGYVRHMKTCNGKVGSIGFCLGGKLSYMLAGNSDVDVSVSYYGVSIETMLDLTEKIKNPLLLHIAGEDEFVDEAAQEKILSSIKPYDHITAYKYNGVNHAFARGQGKHYDEAAADFANSNTVDFLRENLD